MLLHRAGQLLFTVGGHPDARSRVTPILEGMGRGVVDIGNRAEQAAIIKITGIQQISADTLDATVMMSFARDASSDQFHILAQLCADLSC